MSPDKVRKLQQMGLGPVWKRRTLSAVDGHRPVSAAVPVNDEAVVFSSLSSEQFSAEVMAMDWETLAQSIRQCTRCDLCGGRTNAVPGAGDRHARWMIVGEGPGRQEDLQGEPFVGPAGKLLDNMLRALGLSRGANTYIANIVKCRPADVDGQDRPPSVEETVACLPYLSRQIDLIRPDIIIALGQTAAITLLDVPADTTLASLRGKTHHVAGVPLIVTYHPADLLRQPVDKAKSWRDLCMAMRLFNAS
jgi:uracil-DNA glycosylase family 4